MGQANQMLIRQRNEFRLRQGEGPQTDRRTDAERVPVFGAAVQRRRLRKLFFEGAGEGLLRVETVLQGDIQNRPAGQTQRDGGFGQPPCPDVSTDGVTGNIFEHPLQMPFE